jgi:hypothetical protein
MCFLKTQKPGSLAPSRTTARWGSSFVLGPLH